MEIKTSNTESPSQGIQFVKNSVWLEQKVKVSNKITLGRQAGTKYDQPGMSEYNQSYTGEAGEATEDIWAAAFRRLVCILVWISLKAEPEMSTWVQKVYLGEGSREQERERRGGKSSIRVHYQGHFSWQWGTTPSPGCPRSIYKSSQKLLCEGWGLGSYPPASVPH